MILFGILIMADIMEMDMESIVIAIASQVPVLDQADPDALAEVKIAAEEALPAEAIFPAVRQLNRRIPEIRFYPILVAALSGRHRSRHRHKTEDQPREKSM